MALSTIASSLGAIVGVKDPNGVDNTTPIVNFLNGNRTASQMIQEYFGLRKEVIYSDDGTEVVDMINEFKDPEALKLKKVRYNEYFASKGLTEEMFYKCVPRALVYVETPITNLIEDDTNISSVGVVEEKPVVPSPRGRPAKNTR
jgi:hypothetical protein